MPGLTEPIVEPDLIKPEPDRAEMARVRRVLTPGRRSGWLWRIFKVLVIIGLIPVGLTLLYLPSFVHPVSTLMLGDLVTFKGYDRRWVPLEDIAPVLAALRHHVGGRPVL